VEGFEELLRSAVAGHAVMTVRDYQPGVPEGMAPEIFLQFRRVGNDEHDGAGLGLAIAEREVQVHGKRDSRGECERRRVAVEMKLPVEYKL
jgi:K+-sensing histidine kinase KdpD